jgi:hypothetical protein
MPLSDIVNVTITQNARPVAQANFGTLLIVGVNFNIDGRLEYFSDPVSALAKVVGNATLEAALINAAFAQNPSISNIALGAVSASKTGVFTGTMSAGNITASVNGTTYLQTFSSTMDGTLTGLAAKIAANSDVLSAVNTSGTLVVTPKATKAVGVTYDLSAATGTIAVTYSATELAEAYNTALDTIIAQFPDWYGLVAATRTIAKQELVATWTEANKKIYFAGSADTNIINQSVSADTTSIAAYAKNQSLARTAVIYGGNAATEGIEAALFGKILPLNPGSYTAMFKTLSGITVDSLTTSQSANAKGKYANVFESIGGVNIVREGKVGANEYIDIVVFIDWLTSSITSSVYQALVSQLKVPYTQVGIMIVSGAIETPLKIGQNRGGISPTAFAEDKSQIGGYYIQTPSLQSIPIADKVSRTLNDVRFTAFLSGAIHAVVINGVVTF